MEQTHELKITIETVEHSIRFGPSIKFHGAATRDLKAASDSELRAYAQRVVADQRRLNDVARGQPRWYRSIPEVKAERNIYKSELQRIERILNEREAERAAMRERAEMSMQALDANEVRAEMEMA